MESKANLIITFDTDKYETADEIRNVLVEKMNELQKHDDTIKSIEIRSVDIHTDMCHTINMDTMEDAYYKPTCQYEYTDCVLDPAYIKATYPNWWNELGCPENCEGCIDGSNYDDEDK